MVKKIFLLICFIFVCLILGACSNFLSNNYFNAESEQSIIDTDLKSDPSLIHGVLENGFQYYLYQNFKPENRVSIHLDVLAGSMNEKDNQQGLAHYLEHMVFNGSTHFKPGQLVEYFQSIGMDFGGDANAHTGFFETVYDLSLPKGNKANLDKALTIIEDYAGGALLLSSEIDKERGIILSEKRDRDSVSYRTFKASLEFELPGSRIIKRYPIGIKDTINKANHALLKDFYDTWYRPDNMILVMVGDFDISVAKNIIKTKFSNLKPRGKKRECPENKWQDHKGIKTFYHYEPESSSTDITIETISKHDFNLQTFDDLKKDIKNSIGNSILRNRLLRQLGKKDSPFSDISVYSGVYLKNIGFASIGAQTSPDKWQMSLSVLERNLRSVLKFGFTQKELERAKKEYINSLEDSVKKSSTRQSRNIASNIIFKINNKKIFQTPKEKLKILKPFIQSLKIKEIDDSFKDIWKENHRLILVTGNTKIGVNKDDAEKIILSEYKRDIKNKIKRYKDTKTIIFPYLPELIKLSKLNKNITRELIQNKKIFSDLGIVTVDYKNGIRLNLKKTEFKKNEFIFHFAVNGGKKKEPLSKPGLGLVSENLLNESGLGKADKEDLKEILAGTSVDIKFNVEGNCFSFSGQGKPEEIKLVFELVYSYLNDPGFNKDSLKLVKQRYALSYASMNRTPDGLMYIKGNNFLADGDTRFGLPEPSLINKIGINDIKAWIKPFFKKANIEISIVGDFDLKEAELLTAKYFGTMAKRDDLSLKDLSRKLPRFPAEKKLVLNVDTKLDKSQVRLAFLTDDFWDISKTRTFNLLSRIFSERFRIKIREQLGLAYSAYAYNSPSFSYKDYGILHAVVYTKPSNINKVLINMQSIAKSLFQKGVSIKELNLVKKPVLNHIKDMQKTNTYWLNSVLSGSFKHPEQFMWAKNVFDGYSSISKEMISQLANKYLNIDNSTIIIIRPKSIQ